jgi:hypothetical protein
VRSGDGVGAFLVEACRRLGDVLVEAWKRHGFPWDMPSDEGPAVVRPPAGGAVPVRCGPQPMAVDLAKLSLWLVTLAEGLAFTFLDHALRPGGFAGRAVAAAPAPLPLGPVEEGRPGERLRQPSGGGGDAVAGRDQHRGADGPRRAVA